MRWFLQVLGLEVKVLGRVGVDVILAAPLPLQVEAPAPEARPGVAFNHQLAHQLMHLEAVLWFGFTGRRFKLPDARWRS